MVWGVQERMNKITGGLRLNFKNTVPRRKTLRLTPDSPKVQKIKDTFYSKRGHYMYYKSSGTPLGNIIVVVAPQTSNTNSFSQKPSPKICDDPQHPHLKMTTPIELPDDRNESSLAKHIFMLSMI